MSIVSLVRRRPRRRRLKQRQRELRRERRQQRRRRRRRLQQTPAPDPTPTPGPEPDPTPEPPPTSEPDPSPEPAHEPTTEAEWHMLTRMGTGYTPEALERLRAAGSPLDWFEQQLEPASIAEDPRATELAGWFPDLARTPVQKDADNRSGTKGSGLYGRDLRCLTILRRVHSTRQVQEVMVDFWSNHLHVPSTNGSWIFRPGYDDLLRRHALGRFDQLLAEATLHPAMLLYLDTYRSRAGKPNENHGRELLELHTVGREAGYTEAMVLDSAKILSGYTVDTKTWVASYQPRYHTTGAVRVLDFQHVNAAADGRAVTAAYLHHLAHHPSTARLIARKLAVKFVSDTPSAELVGMLAQVYLDNGTAVAPVLRALVRSAEFAASVGRKVRTPVEDLVATVRALEVEVLAPTSTDSYACRALDWAAGGQTLYEWPRPDGAPETGAPYASASRMLASFDMHWGYAAGKRAEQGIRFKAPADWLPAPSLRFDAYVDHLSRTLHGRPADPALRGAATTATGLAATATVTASVLASRSVGVRLLAVLLDHPRHMSR